MTAALETARKIPGNDARVQGLLKIGRARVQAKDLVGAKAAINEAATVEPSNDKQKVLSALAEAKADASDITSALATARRITEKPARAIALQAVARLLAQCEEMSCSGSTL